MSQIERGSGFDPQRVNRADPTQQTGVTRTVIPQQVIIPPPVSRGASLLNQLSAALGTAGQAAGTYDQYERQQAAEQRRLDADAKELYAGQGSLAGRTALATAHEKITNLDPAFTLKPTEDPAEFAQTHADARTDGQPDAFRKAFDREFVPGFIAATTSMREQQFDAHRDADFQLYASAAGSVQNADELDQLWEIANRQYGDQVGKVVLADKILKPALFTAAEANDPQRVGMISDQLGGYLKEEQQRAQLVLRTAGNNQETDNRNAYEDALGKLELKDATAFDAREQFARDYQGIDDATKAKAVDQIRSQRQTYVNQSLAGFKRLEVQQFRAGVLADNLNLVRTAATSGGTARMHDQKITHADGTETPYPLNEQLKDTQEAAFDAIDRQLPPEKNAEANFNAKASLILTSGLPAPAWSNIANAPAFQGSIAGIAAAVANGQPAQPSAAMAASDSLHQRLQAVSPQLSDRITTDPHARFFHSVTDLAATYATGGNRQQAMVMAAQAVENRDAWNPTLSDRINPIELDAAVNAATGKLHTFLGDKIVNGEDIKRNIEELSRFAMSKAMGVPPSDALTWATSHVVASTQILNGYAVNTAGHQMPAQLIPAVGELAAKYAKEHPDEGVEAKQITIRPIGGNVWIMTHQVGGTVDSLKDVGAAVVTDADLYNTLTAKQKAENAANKAKVKMNQPQGPKPIAAPAATGMGYQVQYEKPQPYSGPANDYAGDRQ